MAPQIFLWVHKILSLYLLKFVGFRNLWVHVLKILILWVLKFVGIQNLWVLKIYLYSNFAGLNYVGTQKMVGTQICWYFYSKICGTQNAGHFHLWVLKICGYP